MTRLQTCRAVAFAATVIWAGHSQAAASESTSLTAMQNLDQALFAYQETAADASVINNAADLLHDANTPVLGNPDGDVAVVEFFDYKCPYCKAIEPKLEQLIKDDPGVKLVIKEFPILSTGSVTASKAALASIKQGKYQAYHQAMMAHRGQLETDTIFEIAKEVGLDVNRLRRDMDAPEIADQIIVNLKLARALKISVVPGLIIGTHVYSGLSNKTETGKIDFRKAVAEARAKKG